MLTSLVELEECVGSVVGNAWLYLCAGGVVTVFGVDESGGTGRAFIWLWCCGKCLAFLCAWRSCNSGVDESMVELEERVGGDVALWKMLSRCVCLEEEL